MGSRIEVITFLMNGIERKKRDTDYGVEVAEFGGERKWISDHLQAGEGISFSSNSNVQNWILHRKKKSALWSLHIIESTGKRLYASYNNNGAVRMKRKNSNNYERFFMMFVDENGGIRLTSKDSEKNFLAVQAGILTMLQGTGSTSGIQEMSSEREKKKKDVCSSECQETCPTSSKMRQAGSGEQKRRYLIEVNDPDISGLKWSIVDPIAGNVVTLIDQNDQEWEVDIDNLAEIWTFQPLNNLIFLSSQGNDVKFEAPGGDGQERGFNVFQTTGRFGICITTQSNPEKYVGKNGRILRVVDKFQAIGWILSLTRFVFQTGAKSYIFPPHPLLDP